MCRCFTFIYLFIYFLFLFFFLNFVCVCFFYVQDGMLCCHAGNMCVQAVNGVQGLQDGQLYMYIVLFSFLPNYVCGNTSVLLQNLQHFSKENFVSWKCLLEAQDLGISSMMYDGNNALPMLCLII
jgi:hypothetical protein